MAKSKFFCVAVEGATTDGRTIDAAWIQEMAANYDPKTYTANINVEHIRGYSPEAPFNNYGTILALEAREIELTVAGKTEKKAALFAQVDGNDQLVALSKKGQKRFPSIEVNPNFAGKGQAYCVGLGMTDSPASLGTEMLQFAAQAAINPFTSRKQNAGNMFSAADTVDAVLVEFEDETADLTGGQSFNMNALLEGMAKKFGFKPAETPATTTVITPAADQPNFAALFTDLTGLLTSFSDRHEQERAADRATIGQLQAEFNALKTDLEITAPQTFTPRPTASGDAGGIVTDC